MTGDVNVRVELVLFGVQLVGVAWSTHRWIARATLRTSMRSAAASLHVLQLGGSMVVQCFPPDHAIVSIALSWTGKRRSSGRSNTTAGS